MEHITKEFNTGYLYLHRTQNMKNEKEERKIHLKDCFTRYTRHETDIMDLKKKSICFRKETITKETSMKVYKRKFDAVKCIQKVS